MNKLFKIWRIFLPFIFIIVLLHFLKDITQDILKVATPLDVFGNVNEDLTGLSPLLRNLYLYGFGGLSFVAEVFLLCSIPIIWKKKNFSILERNVIIVIFFLGLFFLTATLLDPKFRLS